MAAKRATRIAKVDEEIFDKCKQLCLMKKPGGGMLTTKEIASIANVSDSTIQKIRNVDNYEEYKKTYCGQHSKSEQLMIELESMDNKPEKADTMQEETPEREEKTTMENNYEEYESPYTFVRISTEHYAKLAAKAAALDILTADIKSKIDDGIKSDYELVDDTIVLAVTGMKNYKRRIQKREEEA